MLQRTDYSRARQATRFAGQAVPGIRSLWTVAELILHGLWFLQKPRSAAAFMESREPDENKERRQAR
ncbi:MAG: hypothetical protein CVU16_06105 [Betaproteobacteria bacterium HGW-Betaproteobacteria-10]|nr:MAG: hypothetical protein CVU16_06105 [Betaproteobacteria bacterium HGW-Betaproteobacteria-10]